MSLSTALSGAEIDCLASRMLGYTGVHWLGVFAHDQVPKLDRSQRRPFALVVNTDPSDKPGKHWLAFFAPAEPTAAPLEMFDSYGFSPSMHSLAHVAPRIYSSSVTYQSLDSSVCGHYCLFFLFNRAHGVSYRSVEHMLRSHMHFPPHSTPDSYVSRFVDSVQSVYRVLVPCTRSVHSQTCIKKCFACYFWNIERTIV